MAVPNPVVFLIATSLFHLTPLVDCSCEGQGSMWAPFCTDELLYKPYVHVWRGGGVTKSWVKSRGPGFLQFHDQKDLYICVNGVVVYYFAKTTAHGDIYEEGELQWVPHHCQLYNPSNGPGKEETKGGRRSLKALLLIGHPADYRKPALQMFMAPYMDHPFTSDPDRNNRYVNLTSLLMINAGGECIIEKGDEGLIRVQVNEPKSVADYKGPEKPASFCKFNAQRQSGQTSFVGLRDFDKGEMGRSEAATDQSFLILNTITADKELKFKGCLPYPEFNDEQRRSIIENHKKYGTPGWKRLEEDYNANPPKVADQPAPFWNVIVRGKRRYEREEYSDFRNTPVEKDKYDAEYEGLKSAWDAAVAELETARSTNTDVNTKADDEHTAYMKYHLFPYKNNYEMVFAQLVTWEGMMNARWDFAEKVIKDEEPKIGDTLDEYLAAARAVSELTHERRFDSYNVQQAADLEKYRKTATEAHSKLVEQNVEVARKVAVAEVLKANVLKYKKYIYRRMERLQKIIVKLEARDTKDLDKIDTVAPWPVKDTIISMANYDDDAEEKLCFALPGRVETCAGVKPSSERACSLFQNRKGKGLTWPSLEDNWRDTVLNLVASIFDKVCPYLGADFASSINRLVKGYLTTSPNGTGLQGPVNGSYLYSKGYGYFTQVYNEKYNETMPKLREKRPFWDNLIGALDSCLRKADSMEFYSELMEETGNTVLFFRKYSPNGTFADLDVDQFTMVEQAEKEFTLNWAIDMNWKMFATVLGVCMPTYETQMPHINFRFYSMYFEDFLHPIQQIWMSHRDNPIFRLIYGQYYPNGRGSRWTSSCMESAFQHSSDVTYRPLRWLYVNSFSELNFFTAGPLAGTSGIYFS